MKLAAIYTLFNGTELLARSIEQIKKDVDLVILGSQEVSHAGNEMEVHDAYNIAQAEGSLNEKGYEAFITNYKPSRHHDRKENERRKLDALIQVAKQLGATHYILLAADHFYIPSEFRKAKELVETLGADITLTKMITYYKKPTWRLEHLEDYYMTFINKIHKTTRVTKPAWPYHVDPSLRITPAESFYAFPEEDFLLHHFSMIRKDIAGKFENAAASQNWGKNMVTDFLDEFINYDINKNPGVRYFGGQKVDKTVDNFNLEELNLRGY